MRSLLSIICLVILSKCSTKGTLNFHELTRQVFFNADLNDDNKGLFNYYKTVKSLSFEPPEGYTIYPPLSALGESGHFETYTFRFHTHAHLPFQFREGELIIRIRESEDQELYSKPYLKIIFDTKQQSEVAYQQLVEKFTILSTSKRFTNNSDTKLAEFSNDKSNAGVTLMQGKGDVLANGYVIFIWLENELGVKK